MGQKVNPHGLRVGVIKDWDSRWYADTKNDEFAANLAEDHKIRTYLKKSLYNANISKIEIERAADRVKVALYTAKPGVIIGKGGEMLKKIGTNARYEIEKQLGNKVNLKLWVKVKKEWRDSDILIKNYGYDKKDLKDNR